MTQSPDNKTLIQDNDIQKRLQLRKAFDQYRLEKLEKNKTTVPSFELQSALFKAAKIGNVNLMKEFISNGADPFALDEEGHDAIFYATQADPIKTGNMMLELISKIMQFQEGDN